MFDTIAGLPLHPLIVHGAVVGLPVAALITLLVAVRPSWRRFALPVAVLDALVMVTAWVAKESGERLAGRVTQLSVPEGLADHAEWGDRLFLLSVGLFLGAVVLYAVRQRSGTATVAGVALVVISLSVVVLTAVVGHSGATMVWKSLVTSTSG